jgi:hypothetical protein
VRFKEAPKPNYRRLKKRCRNLSPKYILDDDPPTLNYYKNRLGRGSLLRSRKARKGKKLANVNLEPGLDSFLVNTLNDDLQRLDEPARLH